jgi:protein arginine kinase
MSLEHFLNNEVSSWMKQEGPASDIVLSSRVRLARNLEEMRFPTDENTFFRSELSGNW